MRGSTARRQRSHGEKGQGLVEYGLLLSMVTLISISALTALGFNTAEAIGNIGDALSGLQGPGLCKGATLPQHLQHCSCAGSPHSCKGIGWSC